MHIRSQEIGWMVVFINAHAYTPARKGMRFPLGREMSWKMSIGFNSFSVFMFFQVSLDNGKEIVARGHILQRKLGFPFLLR
jgi:hypothetical protein